MNNKGDLFDELRDVSSVFMLTEGSAPCHVIFSRHALFPLDERLRDVHKEHPRKSKTLNCLSFDR